MPLVVQAWCQNEIVLLPSTAVGTLASRPVSRPISTVIPWQAMMTMLLWVFIRRRNSIVQPLDALLWFLHDIALFDWDRYVRRHQCDDDVRPCDPVPVGRWL